MFALSLPFVRMVFCLLGSSLPLCAPLTLALVSHWVPLIIMSRVDSRSCLLWFWHVTPLVQSNHRARVGGYYYNKLSHFDTKNPCNHVKQCLIHIRVRYFWFSKHSHLFRIKNNILRHLIDFYRNLINWVSVEVKIVSMEKWLQFSTGRSVSATDTSMITTDTTHTSIDISSSREKNKFFLAKLLTIQVKQLSKLLTTINT